MLPFSLILLLHSLLVSIPTVVSLPPTDKAWQNGSPHTQSIGRIQTRPTVVYKPRSLGLLHKKRLGGRRTPFPGYQEEDLQWEAQEVVGPNVDDRHTLAQLARMAGNAYALPGQRNWYEVDPAWRMSFPFGWDNPEDGFRGQVFMAADNSTVVLSIKGTTINGPTTRLDKFNDNLLFSCCCAKASWVLKPVCDCSAGRMQCDDRCLHDALVQESLFYSVGTKLVDDLLRIYPNANLGFLLGVTYGVPASHNETDSAFSPFPPPGRPRPPPTNHPLASYITHTRCHLGKSIILDTVNKLHWLVDVRKHIVREVVHLLDLPEHGGRDVDWSEAGGRGPGDEEPQEPGDPEPEPDPWAWNGETFQQSITSVLSNADLDLWGMHWGPTLPGRGKKKKGGEEEDKPKHSGRNKCHDCEKWSFGDYKEIWTNPSFEEAGQL
ncbi:lipase [Coprinopsis sp. MPI-PUGE-AT-0042]|nr:lipase [Coprinopsis sp. MPI-PUGE-AT-0042]